MVTKRRIREVFGHVLLMTEKDGEIFFDLFGAGGRKDAVAIATRVVRFEGDDAKDQTRVVE